MGVGIIDGEQRIDFLGPVHPGASGPGIHPVRAGQRSDPHKNAALSLPGVLIVFLARAPGCRFDAGTAVLQ